MHALQVFVGRVFTERSLRRVGESLWLRISNWNPASGHHIFHILRRILRFPSPVLGTDFLRSQI